MDKSSIPENIEELLINNVYDNLKKNIKEKKKELSKCIKDIESEIKLNEEILKGDAFKKISRKNKLESL
ncbi:hypothetical protein M0Q50_08895 [bacterium]|jgi:hypothetical protein|nr:hypothetical protein [bacterium]